MKKSKLIAVAMGALCAAVLCSCGGGGSSGSKSKGGDWDIKVFRPAVNPRDHKNDVMVRAADKYTEETGGKVTFVLGDWGTVESKVLSNMAAGDPIDVVFVRSYDFPKFKVKGYLQPIDDYVNTNLIDNGENIFNTQAADSVFKYDGHYYAASHYTSNHCWIIIYNKTLMEEEGINERNQPLALYERGEWDWEHLADLCRKLTADTSGSGSIDRWGFGSFQTRNFVYMNGAEFTTVDAAGNMTLNFSDPKISEALSFLLQAKQEGWYQPDNSIAGTGIQDRTCAIVMGREYDPATITQKTDDEICYVPLPTGPSVSKSPNVFECDGYGIGNGSKKQAAAGKFIEYALREWYEDDIKNRASTWPEECVDMVTEMLADDPYYPGPSTSAIDSLVDDFLGEIIWAGNAPASAIEKWTPKARALIADANTPMGTLEKLPFKKVSENFDKLTDADIAALFSYFETTPGAKVSLVEGSDAIGGKGKSLKVSFDSSDGVTSALVALSDPEKLGIVGWRDYKITFDAKIAGETFGDTPVASVQAYANELYQYGVTRKSLETDGSVSTATGSILNVNQNGKIGLALGIENANAILIDNIVIEEN